MQVSKTMRANVLRREARGYGSGQPPLVLVQFLRRESAAPSGANTTLREFQMIALLDTPGLKRGLRKNYPQGVAYAPKSQFHLSIITRYNFALNIADRAMRPPTWPKGQV